MCVQTGLVAILNTFHMALAMHVPWYYLIDDTSGKNVFSIVWTWPMTILITVNISFIAPSVVRYPDCRQVLISLPVYAFYIRRIYVLGGHIGICIAIVRFRSKWSAPALTCSAL
jgi:hypothetical protein